jgi:hypothetical protein
VEPRVDDVHPDVAQASRDNLDAAIVPVEPDLGEQHADRPLTHAGSTITCS